MDIVLYSLLLLAGLAFIGQPFYAGRRRRPERRSLDADGREQLLMEKQAVYAAIKDLDFEYKTGKLSDEDYAALRESYRARALNILKQISEQGKPGARTDGGVRPGGESLPQQETRPGSVADAVGEEVHGSRCAQCGEVNRRGSKFCRSCGTPLQTELLCDSCGAVRHPGDRFCRECGRSFVA